MPLLARPLFALLILGTAGAARAQIGADVTILTDDRFRGHSLSNGRPIAVLGLTYDHRSGFYGGGTVAGIDTAREGLRPLGVQGYAGYAHRLGDGPTLDLGVTLTRYSRYYSAQRGADYAEIYVGLTTRIFSARLHYSPDYFGYGVPTLYGDLSSALKLDRDWRLTLHAGVLQYLGGNLPTGFLRTREDWRIGIRRGVGRVGLQLDLTGIAPGQDYYDGRPHDAKAVVGGISYTF